jgi:hypothetical protein
MSSTDVMSFSKIETISEHTRFAVECKNSLNDIREVLIPNSIFIHSAVMGERRLLLIWTLFPKGGAIAFRLKVTEKWSLSPSTTARSSSVGVDNGVMMRSKMDPPM